MVLDNRKNLKMDKDQNSFKSLVNDLYYEEDITDLREVCSPSSNANFCR